MKALLFSTLIVMIGLPGLAADKAPKTTPAPIKATCQETGQKSPYIGAEIYEDRNEVVLSYGFGSAIAKQETLTEEEEGSLLISHATTDNGEAVILINHLTTTEDDFQIRVLVCLKAKN